MNWRESLDVMRKSDLPLMAFFKQLKSPVRDQILGFLLMDFAPVSVVSSWWGEGTEIQKIQQWNRGGLLVRTWGEK